MGIEIIYKYGNEEISNETIHDFSGGIQLKEDIEINGKNYSFNWKENVEWKGKDESSIEESNSIDDIPDDARSVTVFAKEEVVDKELKIPVRVKINYDPSNKLEDWVENHVRHKFSRKTCFNPAEWKEIKIEDSKRNIEAVEGSVKINLDGSKTQDFIFTYQVEDLQDKTGRSLCEFGFDKEYINVKDDSASYGMDEGNAFMTYMKQDVGGGKQLFIDYDIDQDQILENYSNYNS